MATPRVWSDMMRSTPLVPVWISAAVLTTRFRSASIALACALLLACAQTGSAAESWIVDNLKQIGGHPVTVVGAPRVIESALGKALEFDGARDGVFIPAVPIAGAKAFTIELLYSPAAAGPEAQRFFHVQDNDGRRALLELRMNDKGWWLDAFMRTSRDAADHGLVLIDPKQVHPAGRWYWVAMRYDGKRMTSFVNGVKQLEGEYSFEPIGDGKISLGVRQNLVSWFKGAIREVRFHREAIPDEKLQRREAE